jgi:hypothetical protein
MSYLTVWLVSYIISSWIIVCIDFIWAFVWSYAAWVDAKQIVCGSYERGCKSVDAKQIVLPLMASGYTLPFPAGQACTSVVVYARRKCMYTE